MNLCECGCGQEVTIYRGKPRRFVHGHRDSAVTAKLEHQGYKVLRFWESDINENIEKCVGVIMGELCL